MLDLIVLPKQGNAGGRIFPHSGHLGVSPVTVAGTVATRLPAVTALLPTKSVTVTVRCFETRFSGTFAQEVEKVLYEKSKVIWEPSGSDEYEDLGDWQGAFKISIPPDVVSQTHSAQWMKEWKTTWRLEIAVDHRPIPHVGHRIVRFFTLNLFNHRTPPTLPPTPPAPIDLPGAEVLVESPHGAYGPGDTFITSLFIKIDDPSTCVRKVSAILERRMESIDPEGTPPRCSPDPPPNPSRLSNLLLRRSVSPRPPTLANILEAPSTPQSVSSSSSVHSLAVSKLVECTAEDIVPDIESMYRCSIPITLPRRSGRWDLGETLTSNLVNIAFDLRFKVSLKSKKGTKEYALPAFSVHICGASAKDRSEALACASPLKSTKRKHRSSRRGLYMQEGTVDIADPIVAQSMRRRRTRSQTNSPIITQIAAVPNVKSILLAPSHTPQPQSISFVFPSPNPQESPADFKEEFENVTPPTMPTILQPLPYFITPPASRRSLEPIDYESMSILRQYQQTGRRISTTASEEEEMQPSRVRQRTLDHDPHSRPALPSLSALGLGLPQLPDEGRPERRPRTAPVHSAFSMSNIPPPLSGHLSAESQGRPVTSAGSKVSAPPAPLFAFEVGR